MRPRTKDLASRGRWCSRAMTIEIREGRGVGKKKDRYLLHLDHRSQGAAGKAAGHFRNRYGFSPSATSRASIPIAPTVHYNKGGIPHQLSRRGLADQEETGDTMPSCPAYYGARRSGLRLVLAPNRLAPIH